MSSLAHSWRDPAYYRELFGTKIPRHLRRMWARIRRGDPPLEVLEDEVREELGEGRDQIG